ncbi:amidase family protein [Nostoc sp. TCL240-02]|uniref:amidase family protein n=1 Tax=Nostoc sp. TCL240-02 TaxID=2572090 RepID=UPI0020C61A1F|nr:amidase family protein [Nostoc sp. TCL240-02]
MKGKVDTPSRNPPILAKLGAIVEEVDPGFANPRSIFQTFWKAGAAKLLRGFSPEQQAVIKEGLQANAKEGDAFGGLRQRITLTEYLSTQDAREVLGRHLQRFHLNYDLLITPTLPVVAFPVGQNRPLSYIDHLERDWSPFAYPFNLTQQPAASIPCGFTKNGLPVGIQTVAAKYRDLLVLQAAKAYETVSPFIMPLEVNTNLSQ